MNASVHEVGPGTNVPTLLRNKYDSKKVMPWVGSVGNRCLKVPRDLVRRQFVCVPTPPPLPRILVNI